jgi:hypothetical protein
MKHWQAQRAICLLSIPLMVVVLALVSFMAAPGYASIETYSFSGSDEGGTGSGTMEFDGIGTSSLTVTIDNTSPLLLDNLDPLSVNAPGITGFGFDADAPIPTLVSWTLTAWDITGSTLYTIGGTGPSTLDWVMTSASQGIQLDFLPTTDNGVQGALYNPLQDEGFGAEPNYFTEAVLTVEFDSIFNLATHDSGTGEVDASPFLRFQNVGLNGEGSLKLPPGPPPGGGGNVPEPVSLVVWGLLATIGVGAQHRRNRMR